MKEYFLKRKMSQHLQVKGRQKREGDGIDNRSKKEGDVDTEERVSH